MSHLPQTKFAYTLDPQETGVDVRKIVQTVIAYLPIDLAFT